MHYRHWVGRNRGNKTSSLQPGYRNAISCQSLCFGGSGGQNGACDNVSANSQAKVSWDPKPPKATAKPYSRHILGIYSGVQSHPKATPRPTDSQPIGTPKPPQSHPKAPPKPHQSHTKASPKPPSCDPQATPKLGNRVLVHRRSQGPPLGLRR